MLYYIIGGFTMCGIVAYASTKQATPVLFFCLEKLEYRGYDSSGIATNHNGDFEVTKSVGKLENLKNELEISPCNGNSGIAHTRWATHGKPTIENAHPHSTNRFCLVHNGIIENVKELKEEFFKNTVFSSDTDTEVIVRLLQKLTDDGKTLQQSIISLFSLLEGSYALAILDKQTPDIIYIVKNKSPLIIGKGNGFNIAASDTIAMRSQTDTFYDLKDKEFATISPDTIKIYNEKEELIERKPYKSDICDIEYQKNGYQHYMLKEIEEQPDVIRRIISKYSSKDIISTQMLEDIRCCDKLFIVACGTSYHAGCCAKDFFEKISGIQTEVMIASEFVYNTPLMPKNPFFIFISQSGETADLIGALIKLTQLGYKTLTITNVKSSTLYKKSTHKLLLYAGPEIAVASTKAYTAQLAVLAILAYNVKNKINIDILYELKNISNAIENIIKSKEKLSKLSKKMLLNTNNCFYIGRGIDYYVCLEAALKLKEISYIHTEGFAAGELKHGTLALIEKNTPVIAIITQKNIKKNTLANVEEIRARGAGVAIISTKSQNIKNSDFIIDDICELLSPILSVVPTQYIAYYTALEKGCDIDKPRNLAKSVTVE